MKKGSPHQAEVHEKWTVINDTHGKPRISRYTTSKVPADRLRAA